MNKKIIAAFVTSALTVLAVSPVSFSAAAATVDEVAAVARSYGLSEEDIQAGYNVYYSNPDEYPPEKLDLVISKLHETGGAIVSTGNYNPDYTPPTTTTSAAADDTKQTNQVTLTADDGSTFTRISAEEFIAMTYDEKMAYLSSFPQDRQQIIINNLTPAEYRNLIKLSPSEKKMEIVHSLSGAADEMGLVVTVDDVSDDSLTISMRNDEGTLVNVSSAGATVEDTGYDRRWIYAVIAAVFAAAAASLVYIANKCFGKEETE